MTWDDVIWSRPVGWLRLAWFLLVALSFVCFVLSGLAALLLGLNEVAVVVWKFCALVMGGLLLLSFSFVSFGLIAYQILKWRDPNEWTSLNILLILVGFLPVYYRDVQFVMKMFAWFSGAEAWPWL